MENTRQRRITLTQWLLIVIIAALIVNAVLQSISTMQACCSAWFDSCAKHADARAAFAGVRPARRSRRCGENLEECESRSSGRNATSGRYEMSQLARKPDHENAPPAERSDPPNLNTRRIERLPYRTVE